MDTSRVSTEAFVDHVPKIRRIVSRIAKLEGVIDDITQEACIRIIEKENLWNKRPDHFTQWMNTVTRNLTKNYLKKKRELPLVERKDYLLHSEDEKFSAEQIEWVITQFQRLSQKQQQILNMKYYKGMTVTQIGKELCITQPAVSQYIALALKTLRKRAKAHGLLAVLFPWNWDWSLSMKVVIVMSKLKDLCVVALVVCVVGFVVVEMTGYSFFKENNITQDQALITNVEKSKKNDVETSSKKNNDELVVPKIIASDVQTSDKVMTPALRDQTKNIKSNIKIDALKKRFEKSENTVKNTLHKIGLLEVLVRNQEQKRIVYEQTHDIKIHSRDFEKSKEILQNSLDEIEQLIALTGSEEPLELELNPNHSVDSQITYLKKMLEESEVRAKHVLDKSNLLIELAHLEEGQKLAYQNLHGDDPK